MPAPKTRHDGEGTVFQFDDNGVLKWKAQRTFWDEKGRRRYISGTAGTGKEAMKKRDQNYAKRMNLVAAEPVELSPTLTTYLERYLTSRKAELAPESLRKYRRDFELHILPHLGKTRIAEITTEQLEKLFHETHEELGHSAKWHVFTNFKALLNHATKRGVIDRNPINLVSKPPKKTVVARDDSKWINARVSLAYGFLEWLKNSEKYSEHYPRIKMMFLGLRRSEILGLEWNCVNNLNRKDKATIVVKQQLKRYEKHENGEGLYILPSTKSGKDRVIYLPEDFRLALVQEKKKARVAKDEKFKNLIFLSTRGLPVAHTRHHEIWSKLFNEYLMLDPRKFKPEHYFRPHYARHIAASMMLKKGIQIQAIQAILGHSDAAMAEWYSHLTKEDRKAAAQALSTEKA